MVELELLLGPAPPVMPSSSTSTQQTYDSCCTRAQVVPRREAEGSSRSRPPRRKAADGWSSSSPRAPSMWSQPLAAAATPQLDPAPGSRPHHGFHGSGAGFRWIPRPLLHPDGGGPKFTTKNAGARWFELELVEPRPAKPHPWVTSTRFSDTRPMLLRCATSGSPR